MKKFIYAATMVIAASLAAAMFGSFLVGILAGAAQYGVCQLYKNVKIDED